MAGVPPPSCFGLNTPPMEPSSPIPIAPTMLVPVPTPSMHGVASSSRAVDPAIVSQPPLGHASFPSNFEVTAMSVPQPAYPFYFNNFPTAHNSHPSLPLNDPHGSIVRPPVSASRPFFGYSQFEVGSLSTAPPRPTSIVYYTLLGLGRDYETLVTTLMHVSMNLTFDDLRPRLLLHEQWLKTLTEMED
ncbi:hypothetical protein Cgig2_008943 [Carnegiea gigantea]|uniref:Uncharacterized protein n=1 Tax=Carnegiea gigantea TaxID=171969 RepID=A0A9Q1GXN8_9CARY|nr:hypothetical protein Cgig2_008943 [Carnegiea gigantea]